MVIVELPDPGTGIGLGLKLTVVPEGIPDADRLIALSNPPLTSVVIVEVPWFPCAMLSEAGDAETVKLSPVIQSIRALNAGELLSKCVPSPPVQSVIHTL